jgi:hypothetical protein
MKLVFIHGRSQQAKNHEELRMVWEQALNEGLTAQGLKLPSKIKSVLPFYGVELDQLRKDYDPTKDYLITAKGGDMAPNEILYLNIMEELAENAGLSDEEIQKEFSEELVQKGAQNWAWVHAIARALDKHRKAGETTIRLKTKDVFDYLTKPMIKRRINDIVKNDIGTEPCVVVAHSLGSIVGYNVLYEHPEYDVKGFITVGSPLGLRTMGSRINTPLKMPSCIKGRWFNAYDKKDIVALKPLTKEFFDVDPEVTNYAKVDNQYSDHHGIEGYLEDPIVAKEIYDVLIKHA